jgi:hypothetical protein
MQAEPKDPVSPAADAVAVRKAAEVRGEPDLPRAEGPVSGNWTDSELGATITVVTGSPRLDDVLDAFGADPSQPVTGTDLDDFYGALILARAVEDAVLVLEPNGIRGSELDVLQQLSAAGRRAASWFWNVNALTRLSLADGGVVLASFEPGFHTTPAHPALGSLWGDIDFDNYDISDQALAVIERFTGWRWCRADYQGLYDVELGYLPVGMRTRPGWPQGGGAPSSR